MNCKEIMAAEEQNGGKAVLLFREGMFWRAYERSAYALCKQVHPFKPLKRSYKVLGGGTMVYVGFPMTSEEKYLGDMERHAAGDTLTVSLAEPVDMSTFEAWKAEIPLQESPVQSPAAPPLPPSPSLTGAVAPATPCMAAPAPAGSSAVSAVADALLHYDLASNTPLAAMQFIASLKEMLRTSYAHGTV